MGLSVLRPSKACSFGGIPGHARPCKRQRAGWRMVVCSRAESSMNRQWVLAVDVGTGGSKAAIVSSKGAVLVAAFSPHPAPAPSSWGGPNSLEQDPECWWSATTMAVRSCMLSPQATQLGIRDAHLGAIAVTGQMQDVVIVPSEESADSDLHRSRSHAILYSDTRSATEAEEIATLAGSSALLTSITGSPQGATSLLAKLRWLDKHTPKAVTEADKLLFGGHDYVVWKLCGAVVTDATTASTTGLTDRSFQYAHELLDQVELGHWLNHFPMIHPDDVPCGEVSKSAARKLGLDGLKGVPVFHCCGDLGACTLGAGAGVPGPLYAYIGSSGWVGASFPRFQEHSETVFSPGVFTLGHPDPSTVFRTGSIMTAGGNVKWAVSNLMHDSGVSNGAALQQFDEMAVSAPIGSGGILYLPYLNGERCPFDDSSVRASFIGISASTTKADLFRAVLEGTCFAIRSARDACIGRPCDGSNLPPLRVVGGGALSTLWPVILADSLNQTVEVQAAPQEVGVQGAALLAGKWLGWHSSLSPGGDWTQVQRVVEPSSVASDLYSSLYTTYLRAHDDMQFIFHSLSAFKARKE